MSLSLMTPGFGTDAAPLPWTDGIGPLFGDDWGTGQKTEWFDKPDRSPHAP